jgi:hypothetical protein
MKKKKMGKDTGLQGTEQVSKFLCDGLYVLVIIRVSHVPSS